MLGKSTRNLPKACCQTNDDTSSLDAVTQNGSEKNTDLHGIYQRITFPNVFCKNYLRRVELLCRRKKFKWDPGALLATVRKDTYAKNSGPADFSSSQGPADFPPPLPETPADLTDRCSALPCPRRPAGPAVPRDWPRH